MKLESGQVRKKQLLLLLTDFLSTFFIRKYLDYFGRCFKEFYSLNSGLY